MNQTLTHRTAAAAGMGALFVALFYGKPPGISVPIFTWTTLLCAAGWARARGRRLEPPQALVGAAALAFSAFFALRCAPELALADLGWSAYLTALFFVPWHRGPALGAFRAADFASRPLGLLEDSFSRGGRDFGRLGDELARGPIPWTGMAKGTLLAIPVLGLFFSLMLRADKVFALLFGRSAALAGDHLPGLLPRVALAAAVAALVAGLYGLIAPAAVEETAAPGGGWLEVAAQRGPRLGFVVGTTAVGLVNVLLGAFAAVQAAFLLGGARFIEALGVSYASYALRGFCQMIAIAVFALLFSIMLDQETARETPRQRLLHKVNLLFTSAMTGVTMVSVFYRLWLYEGVYGLTMLRFYSHTFIVYWVAIFGLLAWKVAKEQAEPEFLQRVFAATAAIFLAWNAANPHRRIMESMVARHVEGRGALEPAAVRALSDDGLPALARAAASLDEPTRAWVLRYFGEREVALRGPRPWASANLGRGLALRALGRLSDGPLAEAWAKERGYAALAWAPQGEHRWLADTAVPKAGGPS